VKNRVALIAVIVVVLLSLMVGTVSAIPAQEDDGWLNYTLYSDNILVYPHVVPVIPPRIFTDGNGRYLAEWSYGAWYFGGQEESENCWTGVEVPIGPYNRFFSPHPGLEGDLGQPTHFVWNVFNRTPVVTTIWNGDGDGWLCWKLGKGLAAVAEKNAILDPDKFPPLAASSGGRGHRAPVHIDETANFTLLEDAYAGFDMLYVEVRTPNNLDEFLWAYERGGEVVFPFVKNTDIGDINYTIDNSVEESNAMWDMGGVAGFYLTNPSGKLRLVAYLNKYQYDGAPTVFQKDTQADVTISTAHGVVYQGHFENITAPLDLSFEMNTGTVKDTMRE
jgi:hypothetical protein